MLVRRTVVSALKYAMIGKAPHAVLCKHMDFFLVLLKVRMSNASTIVLPAHFFNDSLHVIIRMKT